MRFTRIDFLVFTLLFLIGCFFFILSNKILIFQWDESRNLVNALEMHESKQYLVTTFNNQPDDWNTKPPLLIWLINFSVSLFGVSISSLRLPSILASLFTLFLGYYLITFKLKLNRIWGVLYILLLFFSIGFSGYHVGFTADFESLLVFCCLGFIFYYFFAINESANLSYKLLALIFLTMGAFTKGVMILMIIPGVVAYLVIYKKIKWGGEKLLYNCSSYISSYCLLLCT